MTLVKNPGNPIPFCSVLTEKWPEHFFKWFSLSLRDSFSQAESIQKLNLLPQVARDLTFPTINTQDSVYRAMPTVSKTEIFQTYGNPSTFRLSSKCVPLLVPCVLVVEMFRSGLFWFGSEHSYACSQQRVLNVLCVLRPGCLSCRRL